MAGKLGARFWVCGVLSAATGALFILTLAWQDWIEGLFGVDPDGGDGSAEWLICAGFAVVSLLSFLIAGRDWLSWRAARTAALGGS
jgi:hypothetical protein